MTVFKTQNHSLVLPPSRVCIIVYVCDVYECLYMHAHVCIFRGQNRTSEVFLHPCPTSCLSEVEAYHFSLTGWAVRIHFFSCPSDGVTGAQAMSRCYRRVLGAQIHALIFAEQGQLWFLERWENWLAEVQAWCQRTSPSGVVGKESKQSIVVLVSCIGRGHSLGQLT